MFFGSVELDEDANDKAKRWNGQGNKERKGKAGKGNKERQGKAGKGADHNKDGRGLKKSKNFFKFF